MKAPQTVLDFQLAKPMEEGFLWVQTSVLPLAIESKY